METTMKKLIAVVVAAALLAGCATGPDRGYYDDNGNYHPSRDATNADRAQTAAGVAAAVGIAGALAVGITALHKANKNKGGDDDHHDHDRDYRPRYQSDYGHHQGHQPRGSYGNPIKYHPHRSW